MKIYKNQFSYLTLFFNFSYLLLCLYCGLRPLDQAH